MSQTLHVLPVLHEGSAACEIADALHAAAQPCAVAVMVLTIICSAIDLLFVPQTHT